MITLGVRHRGFALIDILQQCVTFNRVNTFEWYRQRVYKLDKSYDPGDRAAAFTKAAEWGERIPLGVIFEQARSTFEDQQPELSKGTLANQGIPSGIDRLMTEFE